MFGVTYYAALAIVAILACLVLIAGMIRVAGLMLPRRQRSVMAPPAPAAIPVPVAPEMVLLAPATPALASVPAQQPSPVGQAPAARRRPAFELIGKIPKEGDRPFTKAF